MIILIWRDAVRKIVMFMALHGIYYTVVTGTEIGFAMRMFGKDDTINAIAAMPANMR